MIALSEVILTNNTVLGREAKRWLGNYLPHTSRVKVIAMDEYESCVKFVAPRSFACWSSISVLKPIRHL